MTMHGWTAEGLSTTQQYTTDVKSPLKLLFMSRLIKSYTVIAVVSAVL